MVSTRQMTISAAPGMIDELFDTTSTGSNSVNAATASGSTSSVITRQAAASNGSQSSAIYRNIMGSSSNCSNNNFENNLQKNSIIDTMLKQRIFLLDLPVELLDKIFSYIGYKNVAQLRLVSSKMNQICSSILNSTFQKLQTQTYNHFQNVKKTMPKRESARRIHPSASECDIVETCYMRLSLLEMTFGKHIDKKHCCFFPGAILDEVYYILYYIKTTPKLGRPYKITEELFDLSTMAMEYFKEKLEPGLPAIAYFSKDFLDFSCTKNILTSTRKNSHSNSMPSPPQSNMVLRKGIRKIKQGMKKYNNQLTVLRNDLRFCKRKSTEQTKQITEMQKLLAEQQKQILEYAARLDENDKKNEEMSMKISTLLQEANKCKTELQYWRSKSPASSSVSLNGSMYGENVPQQDLNVFLQQQQDQHYQGNAEIDILSTIFDNKNKVQNNDISIDLTTTFDSNGDISNSGNNFDTASNDSNINTIVTTIKNNEKSTNAVQHTEPHSNNVINNCSSNGSSCFSSISDNASSENNKMTTTTTENVVNTETITSSVISSVGSPKILGKRKFIEAEQMIREATMLTTKQPSLDANAAFTITPSLPATTTVASLCTISGCTDVKKARKVQKPKFPLPSTISTSSCKTRSVQSKQKIL